MDTLGEGDAGLFVERLGSWARVTCSGRPGCLCHFGGTALEARCVWTHLPLLEGGGGRSQATPKPMGGVLPHTWVLLPLCPLLPLAQPG